ncbi:heat shock protein 70 (Hsp 70) family protein [Wolffia australiana]
MIGVDSSSKMSLKLLLIALIISSIGAPIAESAVASIDLGSEWLKVVVVNLKPGQAPISVAINEMSKRKSPALIGFSGGLRVVGEEAAGIAARYPEKVYSAVREMVGKSRGHVRAKIEAAYQSFDLVEDLRGAAGIRTDDGNSTVYSSEELLAMILGYAKGLADAQARVPVVDTVIAVPPFFGQAERKGVIQAAELAGFNVLGLVNEHAGAALQYGIDKDFSNESRNVVLYDMGSGSTYAALVYFSSYKAKEYGKTVSINQFQVKDVRWNTELGGYAMESRLIEHFADEFNKQLGSGFDIRKSPKAMAKLKKQVKRTKEILSANTAAPISVESLHDDRDFRSTITRQKFEELCSDIFEKAIVPLKELLEQSGLTIDQIDAVEIIGGATRVPKLQAKLQEFLGKKELGKHLDADEAIALGAALHAANVSDGIKLNRKLGMIDGSSYGFVIQLDGPDLSEDDRSEQLLIPRMKKLPIKVFKSIKHNKDFEVSLGYEKSHPLPRGASSHKIAKFEISGLTEASERYLARNLSSPIKANLHFSLSRSGIVSLDRAEAVIEYFEWVEVPKKNLTLDVTQTQELNSTADVENKETSPTEDKVDNPITANETQTNVEVPMEKKLKKRTFRVPLKIEEKTEGPETVLSTESFSEAKIRLERLDKKDSDRRRTAELKNNLEAYIYSTKEKLEESSGLEKVSTESERISFKEKLEEVQEWLYMDGEDAAASEFEDRLNSLKTFGEPIFFRLAELSARPAACEQAKSYLSDLPKIIQDLEENRPWIPKSRVDELRGEADRIKIWLEIKESLQKTTPDSASPSFSSSEVHEKIQSLQNKVKSISRIPKPKPKPKPKIEKPAADEESDKPASKDGDEAHDEL